MSSPPAASQPAENVSGTRGLAFAAMLMAVASWAIAFPLITIALDIMGPLTLAAMRFVSAGVLGLAWIAWKRPRLPSLRDGLRFLACGFFGSACYSAFSNLGQETVSAGAASFITNIIPVLTAIVAWPALGERLNRYGWLGCLIGFAGVTYIAVDLPGGLSFGAGAMFIFIATLSAAIYFVLVKPLIARYGAMPSTAFMLVVSALFLLPWYPEALAEAGQANPQQLMAIGGLILLPTVVAYFGSVYALGHLPAGVSTSLIYLIAPLASVFAYLFLGDVPTVATLIGGAIAIVGTAVVAVWGKVEEAPSR